MNDDWFRRDLQLPLGQPSSTEAMSFHGALTDKDLECAKLLLEQGLDPNSKLFNGESLLDLSISHKEPSFARILIDAGAKVNASPLLRATTFFDEAPLVQAINHRQTEIALMLIEAGADVNWKIEQDTVLSRAHTDGLKELIEPLLVAGANPNASIVDCFGDTITDFQRVVQGGDLKIASLFLKHGAKANLCFPNRKSPLVDAVCKRNYEMVRLLVDAGADVTAYTCFGSPIHEAAKFNCAEIVRFLVEKGADVNANHAQYGTPLTAAIHARAMFAIDALLELGADPKLYSQRYSTPIECAASANSTDIFKKLLEAGVTLTSEQEESVMIHAARKHDTTLIQFLFRTGMRPAPRSRVLYTAVVTKNPETVQFLLNKGVDPNADFIPNFDPSRPSHHTPLMAAVAIKRVTMIRSLLDAGARPGVALQLIPFQNNGKLSVMLRTLLSEFGEVPPLRTLCVRAVKAGGVQRPSWLPSFLINFPRQEAKALAALQRKRTKRTKGDSNKKRK